jgi:predicted nucleotidyltransferase component of viral defense system
MLRLCYELDRHSVDLDFWVVRNLDFEKLYWDLKSYLEQYYKISDSVNKYYTILFEIRSPDYPRALKIEIRKEPKKIKVETCIAFSKNSNIQVLVKHVSLEDMMKSKIEAFLSRKEIRDIYDIEFLFRRGISLEADSETVNKLIKGINKLTKNDYSVKLGSLLEPAKRKYYRENNFKLLLMFLHEKLAG